MEPQQPRKIISFTPGPTKLPEKVLLEAQEELLSWKNCGQSVLELSHRSSNFAQIIQSTEARIRQILEVPDNYKVLFMQGGGTGQFAAIPLNLLARNEERSADYLITGYWSAKAVSEAQKYGDVREVFPRMKKFTEIPSKDKWILNPKAAYLYYCANETIQGVELFDIPQAPKGVPLVCDASSYILSCPMDISKFGLVFAGAHKNLGCAGVTLVIVREDLLNYSMVETPSFLSYQMQSNMSSIYNTPPTYAIYIMDLVLKWISEDQGGLSALTERNNHKAKTLYEYIDNSDGFYNCPVNLKIRSRINIVVRIKNGDEALENELVKFAKSNYSIYEIGGHRLVGGIRISLYNAFELDEVKVLITCMNDFKNKH